MNTKFLLITVATVASMATYFRRLPFQNIMVFSALMFLIGLSIESMALKIGVPFASADATGSLSNAAALNAMLWVFFLLNGRNLALLLMSSRRKANIYGIYVLVLTSAFAAGCWYFLDGDIEPLKRLKNFMARFACSVAILLICFPWFLDKRRNYTKPAE